MNSSGEQQDLQFKALADHNRRAILEIVHRQPGITLQELSAQFPVSRFATMKHINILEDAGFLQSQKRSIYRVFTLRPGALRAFAATWFAQFEQQE